MIAICPPWRTASDAIAAESVDLPAPGDPVNPMTRLGLRVVASTV